jgi:hypothetical protein
MEHDHDEPASDESALPALTSLTELDAHGFDPADYKWVPVLRRPRADGWTAQRQVDFIAALADCGCVEQAALEARMSVTSCYRLRRSPGAENFAAAWDAALAQAARKLVDLAFERAINGSEEPVFDREGCRVGRPMRHNDRLLMFLMRAYMPDRFRHAHNSIRHADEEASPGAEAVGQAIRRLEPVAPENPHLLMPPDELETELLCANICGGELPRWYRGRPEIDEPIDAPLGEEFERLLAQAKGEPLPSDECDDDPFLA